MDEERPKTLEPLTRCHEHGFKHAWKEVENHQILMSNPPQYPPRRDKCINCGLIRNHLRIPEKRWFEYQIPSEEELGLKKAPHDS